MSLADDHSSDSAGARDVPLGQQVEKCRIWQQRRWEEELSASAVEGEVP